MIIYIFIYFNIFKYIFTSVPDCGGDKMIMFISPSLRYYDIENIQKEFADSL